MEVEPTNSSGLPEDMKHMGLIMGTTGKNTWNLRDTNGQKKAPKKVLKKGLKNPIKGTEKMPKSLQNKSTKKALKFL
jgi:hypothetical protein